MSSAIKFHIEKYESAYAGSRIASPAMITARKYRPVNSRKMRSHIEWKLSKIDVNVIFCTTFQCSPCKEMRRIRSRDEGSRARP